MNTNKNVDEREVLLSDIKHDLLTFEDANNRYYNLHTTNQDNWENTADIQIIAKEKYNKYLTLPINHLLKNYGLNDDNITYYNEHKMKITDLDELDTETLKKIIAATQNEILFFDLKDQQYLNSCLIEQEPNRIPEYNKDLMRYPMHQMLLQMLMGRTRSRIKFGRSAITNNTLPDLTESYSHLF